MPPSTLSSLAGRDSSHTCILKPHHTHRDVRRARARYRHRRRSPASRPPGARRRRHSSPTAQARSSSPATSSRWTSSSRVADPPGPATPLAPRDTARSDGAPLCGNKRLITRPSEKRAHLDREDETLKISTSFRLASFPQSFRLDRSWPTTFTRRAEAGPGLDEDPDPTTTQRRRRTRRRKNRRRKRTT